jgi:hypothetical protein
MIAFQKNLVAAAHADHLMTQIVKPCLISTGLEDAEKRSRQNNNFEKAL